jgi:hypothetical protein
VREIREDPARRGPLSIEHPLVWGFKSPGLTVANPHGEQDRAECAKTAMVQRGGGWCHTIALGSEEEARLCG